MILCQSGVAVRHFSAKLFWTNNIRRRSILKHEMEGRRKRLTMPVRRPRTMRICSYCGGQYPDGTEVCGIDQQPLVELAEPQSQVAPPRATCPQCGTADDFTPVIDFRSSFSLPAFLFGGLLAVLFRNAGKARPVRCNQCETRFYVSSLFSKISRVIFWLLVAPTIIVLIMFILGLISN